MQAREVPQNSEAASVNKCPVCLILFKSPADKRLAKTAGKKVTWIGCDQEDCHYWGHASCLKVDTSGKKRVSRTPFLCPQHVAAH